MSKDDAVVIVSRIVALYFFCWTAVGLTSVPFSIASYWSMRQVYASSHVTGLMPDHSNGMWLWNEGLTLLRLVGGFAIGVWFYQCGPKAKQFLLPTSSSDAPSIAVQS